MNTENSERETMLQVPTSANIATIRARNMTAAVTMHESQIVGDMAFVPIETIDIDTDTLDAIRLIEELQLGQEVIITDSGSYDRAHVGNQTDKTVVTPAATHMKGGHQNRGFNQTEIFDANEDRTCDVNCFEPSRSHGEDTFTSFDDVPADVAEVTMQKTDGFNGAWDIIRRYNTLSGGGGSLADFNERTKQERTNYALNFETVAGQTGAMAVMPDKTMIEIFPTPETFHVYRPRLLRGKIASLFYRMNKEDANPSLLRYNIDQHTEKATHYISTMIARTMDNGARTDGLQVNRIRRQDAVMDMVITADEPHELVYVFGMVANDANISPK